MESNQERWKQLASLAAKEQDPEKLIRLIQELNTALNKECPLPSDSAEDHLPTDRRM